MSQEEKEDFLDKIELQNENYSKAIEYIQRLVKSTKRTGDELRESVT